MADAGAGASAELALSLRRKLEDDPAHPRHLITVRKAGYRLDG